MVAIWINDNGVEVDVLAGKAIHPAAELFPLMHGPEFDELVDDIALHGQREPIVLTPDGQLLDGRNRWRACAKAGVTPVTRVETSEPWAYVISTNVHRRHLSESQRAMIAAKIRTVGPGGDRRSAAQIYGADPAPVPTQRKAADLFNVSPASVTSARKVMAEGTEALQELVAAGEMPVYTAARVAKALPAEEQDQFAHRVRNGADPKKLASALDAPSEKDPASFRGLRAAREDNRGANRHQYVTVSAIRALRDSLYALDIVLRNTDGIDPAVTSEEAAQWVGDLSKGRGALRRVQNLLNDRKESNP